MLALAVVVEKRAVHGADGKLARLGHGALHVLGQPEPSAWPRRSNGLIDAKRDGLEDLVAALAQHSAVTARDSARRCVHVQAAALSARAHAELSHSIPYLHSPLLRCLRQIEGLVTGSRRVR